MNGWGASVYGDPCRECGYSWTISLADGVSLVASLPFAYSELLEGWSGRGATSKSLLVGQRVGASCRRQPEDLGGAAHGSHQRCAARRGQLRREQAG